MLDLPKKSPPPGCVMPGILQRKCACGGTPGLSNLKVNEPGDIYEQEADRIANQVLATPAHPVVSGPPPRIQRFARQSNGQMAAVPVSVDRVLPSPGSPLGPTLRQDMEQRFGCDFSSVRVHSGTAAEQSAQDVNASAYTVGKDVVFGAGRFAPELHEGRRLIAHELTHVVQQRSAPMLQRAPVAPWPTCDFESTRTHEGHPVQTIGCKSWPTNLPTHGKAGLKLAGRDKAIQYSLVVTPGHFCETPAGSVALLQYTRKLQIRTDFGHEALLCIEAHTSLQPPFNSRKSDLQQLLAPGDVSLSWKVNVRYSKDILKKQGFDIAEELTHWHSPGTGVLRDHNRSLAELVERQPEFVHFRRSPESQQQSLEDFVEKSAEAEIPKLRKRFEEWKKKHPPSEPKKPSPTSQEELDQFIKNADSALVMTADLVTDFIPYVNTAKFATIAATGVNPVTGEKVGFWGRLLAGIFAIISLIPGADKVVRLLGRGLKFLVQPFVELGGILVRRFTRVGAAIATKLERFWNWLVGESEPALERGALTGSRAVLDIAGMRRYLIDVWQRNPLLHRLTEAQTARGQARHQQLIEILSEFERREGIPVQSVAPGTVQSVRGAGNLASLRSSPGVLQIEEQVFRDTDTLMTEVRHELAYYYAGGPGGVPMLGEGGVNALDILEGVIESGEGIAGIMRTLQ